MGVREQIDEGLSILDQHGVSLDQAKAAALQVHPGISDLHQKLVAAAYAMDWAGAESPKGRDEIAKLIANRSGAFAWDGPVGSGLSLQDYRLAMLRMAGDVVEFAKLLGLEEAS